MNIGHRVFDLPNFHKEEKKFLKKQPVFLLQPAFIVSSSMANFNLDIENDKFDFVIKICCPFWVMGIIANGAQQGHGVDNLDGTYFCH
ncbi:hypothetical protein T4E_8084 [Trichinella pseudospiralis]|uniref:Uncharacterized protein n=1 Tax=Trichinella pseudospiralis TaxID=6337 RepID=A0A0V1FD40_TRIPS|nr:hypothetical protein T4E_8084 [Trichinella pseudospiralis]KRY83219.1 hypothetical protein T4D_6549 [Trichinella pseudospiralis]